MSMAGTSSRQCVALVCSSLSEALISADELEAGLIAASPPHRRRIASVCGYEPTPIELVDGPLEKVPQAVGTLLVR